MIDVKRKICVHNGYNTQLTYGYVGKKVQYCKEHVKDGMIDLKNQICSHPDCVILASYGYEAGNIKYCKNHDAERMINVKNKRCEHTGCIIISSYNKLYTKTKIIAFNIVPRRATVP